MVQLINLWRAYRERLYYSAGFSLIQCVKALMSFEDEVIPSQCFPRERRINLYEGSASIASTRETWQCHREST